LWTIYEQWGWGTADAGRALGYLKRFGSVTVLNGHIHQIIPEGRRQSHLPYRGIDGISPAGAGHRPGSWPDEGGARRGAAQIPLGIRTVNYVRGKGAPALIDSSLVA